MQKSSSKLQETIISVQFFSIRLIWICGLVVKASSCVAGDVGLIPAGCRNIHAAQPVCVALNQSVHWHMNFYIAAQPVLIIFFFLGFRQWRSRADRVLTLNMNIWLPLFWSTWSRARGQDSATYVLAWSTRVIRALEQNHKSAWPMAIVFPCIVENTWKQWPRVEGWKQPSPPKLNKPKTNSNSTLFIPVSRTRIKNSLSQFRHLQTSKDLKKNSNSTQVIQGFWDNSLGDESWNQITVVLNFGIFNGPKKNLNSAQIILGFQSR